MHVMMFLFCFFTASLAALPPGFEDEIYCPDQMCLRDLIHAPYKTGPRTMFLECFNPETQKTCRPRAWGVRLDQSYKEELRLEQWKTADRCDEELKRSYKMLNLRLDNVIGKLAWLSFI